jgi:type I restriction-modification system DNA methylase subunit
MITVQTLKQIELSFRQFGYEADDVFNALLSCYVDLFEIQPTELLNSLYEKGKKITNIVFQDTVLKEIIIYQVKTDKQGDNLSVIYQYFLAKRFRDITGKFFTPKDLAAQMASMLPIKKNAIIMDPTCGGGTFLKEVSKQWVDTPCTLIGNDIDEMLVCLTALTLHIRKKNHHHIELICNNLYAPKPDLQQWFGKVDYILANPPFSLPIDSFSSDSKLFQLGYRNSDALFIDLAFDLLKTGGRLVCLLPHSIVSNKEFEKLRKTVELDWHLSAVLVLPEGVFQPSAQTTTRADIIILDKKEIHNSKKKTIFSNIASVGVPLNAKQTQSEKNDLQTLLKSKAVVEILGIL